MNTHDAISANATSSQLFLSFFKIGSFTIGGGFAMIPLMEQELVDKKRWLTREEFLDCLSIGQAMPGIFAVNMASSIGYRLNGIKGALSAIVGNICMPVLTILLLAVFFRHFKDYTVVEHIFMGIRPAVVALIAAPVFNLAKSAKVNWSNCWIPILAALLIWIWGFSPVWIILGTIVLGIVYRRIRS